MSDVIRRRKRTLRRQAREAVLALRDRAGRDEAIGRRFLACDAYASSRTVLLYVSGFAEECATAPLIAAALESGRTLLLPRVAPKRHEMLLCRVDDPVHDLAPGYADIPEPVPSCPWQELETVDLVLVPGLAFDEQGYRVGRGGGYYDRLLADHRCRARTCAIAYDVQLTAAVPREAHDRPVEAILTESRTIEPPQAQRIQT